MARSVMLYFLQRVSAIETMCRGTIRLLLYAYWYLLWMGNVILVLIQCLTLFLGKHWRATRMGAHCQCSPEADHDFLVDPPLNGVPRGGAPSQ